MAGVGHPNPNVSDIKKGTDRNQVLLILGKPTKTITTTTGTTDLYVLEYDNESNIGPAVGWFFLDLLTVGIWEIPGTAIEASRGYKVNYSITYDKKDKVVEFISAKK